MTARGVAGRSAHPLLGEGWHPPEAWGALVFDARRDLAFRRPGGAGEEIELTFSCVLAAGLFQRVAVHSGPARLRRWYRLRRDAAHGTEIVLRHRVAERDPVVTVTFSTLVRYLAARHGFPDGRTQDSESGSGA